ncbi:RNA polymerase sigma factor [Cellulomonas sp. Root137]|uniref:RNA polymerase sigma factor n=1 Tax=Cellulomonas sp. Root137 TaxID=1736459 RepID=UPI0006F45213|nr:sigma-70 family RNA polymerase sigma factor [Cellulomonas sp. Root137]KQY42849.1 RNA polymerase subunit sigma-24 [Cellulomonas sp. Root137]
MTSPEERFAALFDATHRALLAYAVRRVADPADAADVVAETYLVAWRRLEDVPPADQARPWLFGVARRVLANYYRGERRRHALADRLRDGLTDIAAPPADLSDVTVALERLGDDDRELLRLVAWEDLARDEIAVALGVSRATVRVRLHRARQRLLREMTALADEQRVAPSGHVGDGWAPARPEVEEVR